MRKADLGYVAGVVDCDGFIGICQTGRRAKDKTIRYIEYAPTVAVVNTKRWLLEWFRFSFGGRIKKMPRSEKDTVNRHPENWKDCWRWEVTYRQALDFLRPILPYLKLKRAQAEIAIAFEERKVVGKAKSDEERAVEEAEIILMRNLNKRGIGETEPFRYPPKLPKYEMTEEHKKHIGETLRNKYANGEIVHPFKGKHHTLEARQKNAEKHRGCRQSEETKERRRRSLIKYYEEHPEARERQAQFSLRRWTKGETVLQPVVDTASQNLKERSKSE